MRAIEHFVSICLFLGWILLASPTGQTIYVGHMWKERYEPVARQGTKMQQEPTVGEGDMRMGN